MQISSNVLAMLEKLERGASSDAETTLSEWIDIDERLEGQVVIALVRSVISRAADGKEGIFIREPPEYLAAVKLVKNSVLHEILEYDSSKNMLSISAKIQLMTAGAC